MKPLALKIIVIIAIVLVLLLIGTLISLPFIIMPMFLGKRIEQQQFSPEDYGVDAHRIDLKTDDGLLLAAWQTQAENPKGSVIILSGIENPSVTAFFGYAKFLADNSWNSLLIEMRARSESEGEEIGLGMTEWLDVKAGVDYLSKSEQESLPIVAMGSSMGGSTVIISAGEITEIDGVISISAFSTWSNIFAEYMSMSGVPKFIGVLEKPFVNMYLGLHYGFDALKYSPVNGISKLGNRPILMMHSTEDSQVPYSEYEILLSEAEKNNINVSSFVREGDEHFVCYERYIDSPEQDKEFSGAILDFLNDNF